MAVPMVGASTEATVTPTDEPAAAPTDEPTAAPTDEPAAIPTDEPTAIPTDEPTAVPIDEPTDEPAATDAPTDEPPAMPTDEPAATTTNTPILSGPPTIVSDQADYTPGSTVTLTGANWQPGEIVHIFVNDDVGQAWSLNSDPDPVADDTGSFTYQFELPDLFVAMYSVTATGGASGTATTTFTDAIPNNVSMLTWRTSGSGAWIQGTLNQNNSNYKEGETVPFRIELGTLATSGNPYSAAICRDYQTGTVFGYTQLLPFNTSRAATPGGPITSSSAAGAWPAGTFQGVNITISSVTETGGPGACGSTQRETIVAFNASGSGPQYLLWGGRLSSPTDAGVGFGNSASFYPGGSLQMRLESPDKTAGINPSGIIQLAKLTVTKVVDSGSATPDQWCFTVTGPNSYNSTQCVPSGQSSVDFIGLETGSYAVTESNVAGYAFVSGSGTNCTFNGSTATAAVIAAAGGATNASCTFHNAIQQGTLTVIKHVVTDNGGTAAADQWSIHVKSGSSEVSGSPQAGSESGTSYTLTGGTYNVSETGGPSGYTFDGFTGDCDSSGNVTVVAGQNKTCTLTNNDQTAHLTLVKNVTNDNGGTAAAAAWTLTADGTVDYSGAGGFDQDINADTYALSESAGPAGYSAGSFDCGAGAVTSVTLALGESKTCTITNDDITAHLKLVKVVVNNNGGTAVATDWTLDANGPTPISGAGGAESDVNAGTYTLTESTGPTGYSTTGYDCGASVTLALGESKTCTITNDDITAHLKLVKTVTNDNGGLAVETDFTLSAAGPTPISGAGGAESDVNTGTYDLSETSVPGYTASAWVCNGGTQNGASVTLALGENATCTINNDDQTAHLKLVKTVTNDNGGTALPTAWTLTADGTGTNDISGAGGFDQDVNADTYALSESAGPAGYSAGSFDCGTGAVTSVTLALGESKTCTITNDDQTAHLTLIKNVTNDNGGTAQAADWTLTADGTGANDISGAGGFDQDVNADTYALSESAGPAGYSAGSFDCGAGAVTSVTLALGESKTCTITNDDQPATLTVIKHVVNDNGGTAQASDFTMNVTGSNPSPASFAGDEGGTNVTLDAGSYSVGESGPSGYSESDSADCSGSIANGETKICTITNDDQAAHLIVIKHVINDNGGLADAADFTLDSGGTNDTPENFAGAEAPGTTITLDAGSYSVSESGPRGYTPSYSADCFGSIANGETKTCTVTNDDQAAQLIVIKHVINDNGGTATAANFTLDSGGDNDTPDDFAGAEAPGTTVTLDAGNYNVIETGPDGYTPSYSDDCAGTIANGETKTCTVTNDDIPPTLIVVKHVINDNGGTADAADFTMSVTGSSPSPASLPGDETGTLVGLNAGSYSVSENSPGGYAASYSSDCTGSIDVGETKTCTVTNDDQAAQLIVIKHVINDNGGTATAANFTLDSGGDNDTPDDFVGAEAPGTTITLDAGSYSVSESGPSGYTASYSSDCSGSIANGETNTCTVTNDDIPPMLIVVKQVVNDNGGTKTAANFTMSVTGSSPSPASFPGDEGGTTVGLNAGSYSVTESDPSGYSSSFSTECTGSIAVGQTKTCTITNDDQTGTIIVQKIIKPTGSPTSFSFQTTGDGGANALPDYQTFSLAGGQQNSQTLDAGSYTVKELVPLGWVLTGIGGSSNSNTPYNCTVTGNGGSTGVGDLNTQTATIDLKNGDTVTCVFENTGQGVTRTQGFWATHSQLANIAWFGGTAFGHTFPGVAATAGIGDNLICGRPIDTLGKLMGAFWSDISKTSTGAKRSALDQARMQILQQLIAAELNASAFGSVPSGGTAKFAQWEAAYCGTNTTAIKNAQQEAASFNTQGDSSTFTPGTSADSKNARAIATYVFWDVLP